MHGSTRRNELFSLSLARSGRPRRRAERRLACAHDTALVRSICAMKGASQGGCRLFFSWRGSHWRSIVAARRNDSANTLMWACPERPSGFAVRRHVDNSSADWRLALSCGGEVARRRKLQFANFSCSRPLVEMEVSELVCQKLVGQRFDYRHSPTNRFRYIGPLRRPPWHQTPKVSQGFFHLVLAGLAVTQDLPFRLVP
jgi:hypothetical protein